MLLREYLKEWTKEDLLNEARSYELKNCSRLKKDDLIDRIVEYLPSHRKFLQKRLWMECSYINTYLEVLRK